jgi:hypothetical protein
MSTNRLDLQRINSLRKEFGKVASFSIWPEIDKKNMKLVSKSIEDTALDFNPSVVLLALNPTVDTTNIYDWCAFHAYYPYSKTGRMAKWFKYPPFYGAYMTDILKYVIETDSRKVMRRWKDDPDLRSNAEKDFIREMEVLGQDDPAIFLLGGNVSSIWEECETLKNKYRAKKVWHYSHQGNNANMIKSWDLASKELGLGGYNPLIS